MDRIGNTDRLCVMGDLNEWVRGRVRLGITDAFRAPGKIKMEGE